MRHVISALTLGLLMAGEAQAQDACTAEVEPNNATLEAQAVSGDWCVSGSADKAGDYIHWTVSETDAQKLWDITVQGGLRAGVETALRRRTDDKDTVPKFNRMGFIGYNAQPASGTTGTWEALRLAPGDYYIAVSADTAGGQYKLSASSSALPANADTEPNDSLPQGRPISLNTWHAGDGAGSVDWYKFTLDADQSGHTLDLAIQGVAGTAGGFRIAVTNDKGGTVARAGSGYDFNATIRNMALEAGTYGISVHTSGKSDSAPYQLRLAARPGDGAREVEPNDGFKIGTDVSNADTIRGDLDGEKTSDFFRFQVDEARAKKRYTVELQSELADVNRFCLLDETGQKIQCRGGVRTLTLPDLALTPGVYGMEVSGTNRGRTPYTISIREQGPMTPVLEAEPNDTFVLAKTLGPGNLARGRLVGKEEDFYALHVTGAPQLWRLQVTGKSEYSLRLFNAGRAPIAVRQNQQGLAQLSNMLLLPGRHVIAVSGTDADYLFRAIPLGPPPPGMEREPNNIVGTDNVLERGVAARGTLAEMADVDRFVFPVHVAEHMELVFTPPPDGKAVMDIQWDGTSIAKTAPLSAPYMFRTVFQPGQYQIVIWPQQQSEIEYKLELKQLDPFRTSFDLEPNSDFDPERRIPADFILRGVAEAYGSDTDRFRLPEITRSATMTVTSNGDAFPYILVYEGKTWKRKILVAGTDPKVKTLALEPAAAHYIVIGRGLKETAANGLAYDLELSFDPGPLPGPPAPEELTAELSLPAEAPRPAAYARDAQRLSLPLTIRNTGKSPLKLSLDADIAHYLWQVEFAEPDISVPAGSTAKTMAVVHVGPDAWADQPVRLTVAARDDTGAFTTAHVDIVPDRDGLPITPEHVWPVPAALLGGLNVAWAPFGASPVVSDDPKIKAKVRNLKWINDGMATLNDSVEIRNDTWDEPRGVTLKLPGDQPIEIAGIQIHPQGGHPLTQQPKDFVVQTSSDGNNFSVVYKGQLTAAPVEHSFVFDKPIKAQYLRLMPTSSFGPRSATGSVVKLGELKIIATPGSRPLGDRPINIALPLLGGHVSWASPEIHRASWDGVMLSPEHEKFRNRLSPSIHGDKIRWSQQWALSFHHNRAAQITGIEWVDSKSEGERYSRVALAASTRSPAGPWTKIGEWDLTDADNAQGEGVTRIALDAPVWVRYLRFTATNEGPFDPAVRNQPTKVIRAPNELKVFEREEDAEYRSILGAWGHYRKEAIFEALNPPPLIAADVDNNDTRDSATPLPLGKSMTGFAQLDKDVDWYRIEVPASDNTLDVALGGLRNVEVDADLTDNDGKPVQLVRTTRASAANTNKLTYQAQVTGGQTYYLRVSEPPWNIAFLWDNSGSMGQYVPLVYAAITEFAKDIRTHQKANLMPFGHSTFLLDEWTDQPLTLVQAINDYNRADGSSASERTILEALRLMEDLDGARAIVMITDAATPRDSAVWDMLKKHQPRIFTIGVGSTGTLGLIGGSGTLAQDLLQSWAAVNDGYYDYPRTSSEMQVAYDRAATWMRRAKPYSITAASAATVPGMLEIKGRSPGTAVEIVLDASGSMLQRLDGERRINIAKQVVTDLVTSTLDARTTFAFRAFGHRNPDECYTRMEIAPAALNVAKVRQTVAKIQAKNLAKTPIGAALKGVSNDLKKIEGERLVILITDGEETCDGDPAAEIQALIAANQNTRVHIVGFAIDDAALKAEFRRWAGLGGGRYFQADNAVELQQALAVALLPAFEILDGSDNVIASGTSNDPAITLPPGTYRVRVHTLPETTLGDVVVREGKKTVIDLNK